MARKKTDVVEETSVVTSTTEENNNTDIKAILEQMKAMQAQITQLQKEKEEAVESKSSADALIEALKKSLKEKDSSSDVDIDVPVMSGCLGKLVLSTDGKGMETKYKFYHMGEVQDIPYSDLKDICKNMKSFAQKGLFYILDEKIVKKLRLAGHYNKMATQDDIVNLFEHTPNEIIGIYSIASDEQKEIIVSMIMEKKNNGEPVDYNVLAEIGKQCGKNLLANDED